MKKTTDRLTNLIIDPNPPKDHYALNTTLAERLARHLGGETKVIRLYDSSQRYFNYEYNQEWIESLWEADRLVFPVPMWNFGIPAALKDFFDKISPKGELWDFDEKKNYIGRLKGKSAFIIMTSAEIYPADSPKDFVVPYLRLILGFLGIEAVREFRLGGVKDRNLAADEAYMNRVTSEMLKTFGLKA